MYKPPPRASILAGVLWQVKENKLGSYLSRCAAVPSCLAVHWRTQIGLAFRVS